MSDEGQLIEAASVGVRTMADGTLRLTVDIEPRHARDAFGLFGAPGSPVVLARLTQEAAQAAVHRQAAPERPKGGPLAALAGAICQHLEFNTWLQAEFGDRYAEWEDTPIWSASVLRDVCGVESRAELDHDHAAALRFHELIRQPFARHLADSGVTA